MGEVKSINVGKQTSVDRILASDPDAVGCVIISGEEGTEILTFGNITASALAAIGSIVTHHAMRKLFNEK